MNKLRKVEEEIKKWTNCLGPLDMLYELATRCTGNKWLMKEPRLNNPCIFLFLWMNE